MTTARQFSTGTPVPTRALKLLPLLGNHPFRPGIIPERMIWTSSAVKLWRSCKRKFFWRYILRLTPRARSEPLLVGSLFHETLGEWYKTKRSNIAKIANRRVRVALVELKKNAPLYDQEEYDDIQVAISMLEGMLSGYADVYAQDREEWHVEPELIESRFLLNMGDFDYSGSIDLGLRKRKAIVEHKTASNIGDAYIDRLALDTQIRGYVAGARYGLKIPVTEVIYNVTKKSKLRRKANETHEDFCKRVSLDYSSRPDFYFWRESLKFSSSDIDAWEHEVRQVHAEYTDLLARCMDPLDPREWGINDGNCNQYFKLCFFHKLCTTCLDKGSSMNFTQRESLHEELEDKVGSA